MNVQLVTAITEAWRRADLARDDLHHLANFVGENGEDDEMAPCVIDLSAAITELEQAWMLATGEHDTSKLRQLVHGVGVVS